MVQRNVQSYPEVRSFSWKLRCTCQVCIYLSISVPSQSGLPHYSLRCICSRCQRGLCRGSPNSPSQHQGSPLSNVPSNAESRLAVTYTKSKGPAPQPYNPRTLPPPELPPRAISPSTTTVSSSWHGAAQSNQGPNQETSPPRHNDQNAVATPLGRSHSAVMTANIRKYLKYITMNCFFFYKCYNYAMFLLSFPW